MILQNNEITLRRLEQGDIEIVRAWRNDPKIQQYMAYRDYITLEMQERWFNSINNDNNYFFIIEHQDKKIGLTEIKKINRELLCGEGGIFIYEEQYLNSVLPYSIVFLLYDFAFDRLQLNYIVAHILRTNRRAIRFNTSIGFVLDEGQEEVENQRYILTRDDYRAKSGHILRLLSR